ncbi:hypothetical protein [Streptomyces sp. NBC_00470]|uniref:hypothetical protein n=1 Tax=Streptomyces sp. NBC_00470 TaxID=2975753 RepID=UPI002F907A23
MSVFDDVALICYPMPAPGQVPDDVYSDVCEAVLADRAEMIRNLEAASDADFEANEPLLSTINSARRRKEDADAEIRRLIAYGLNFTRPRTYMLADLAAASGLSVSGVRTAYGEREVAEVEQAIGRPASRQRGPAASADDPAAPTRTAQ